VLAAGRTSGRKQQTQTPIKEEDAEESEEDPLKKFNSPITGVKP
jgi:hypothetical protein